MYLSELIEDLEQIDPDLVAEEGFGNPHSYRGSYDCVSFEPMSNVRFGDMLASAREALGSIYEGWKGGEFLMDEYTNCYLAEVGTTGGEITAMLLHLMVKLAELQS